MLLHEERYNFTKPNSILVLGLEDAENFAYIFDCKDQKIFIHRIYLDIFNINFFFLNTGSIEK